MTDDLDKLEAIAKAAQAKEPGEWLYDERNELIVHRIGDWHNESIVSGEPVNWGNSGISCYDEVARHIAAFSPDVVLRLIARVRELEGENSVMWADKNAAMMRKPDIPRSLFDDEKGKRLAAEAKAAHLRSQLDAVRSFLDGLTSVAHPVGTAAETMLAWLGKP